MTPMTVLASGLVSSSLRALIGTHRAERIPRSWTLLPLLNRWSLMALLESTPSPVVMTWLMIVREAWIFGGRDDSSAAAVGSEVNKDCGGPLTQSPSPPGAG